MLELAILIQIPIFRGKRFIMTTTNSTLTLTSLAAAYAAVASKAAYADLSAYEIYTAASKAAYAAFRGKDSIARLEAQRDADVALRAYSASRAGRFHDTDSVVNEKGKFRERYGISPEWDGKERAV